MIDLEADITGEHSKPKLVGSDRDKQYDTSRCRFLLTKLAWTVFSSKLLSLEIGGGTVARDGNERGAAPQCLWGENRWEKIIDNIFVIKN